ncbi:putative SLA/LP autoantigen-like protein [Leptomonas seymouri]|uniref:O-phosphoseryl-tRNA(Sec) selenium transferase n=1 Tax=Leptomonas seymouri TaxID=5684 RepID=A0A0N1IGI4_LEPSE|nr:putative SLA/LP autoantigen-like protein [Leptomonas seymouri]|eukprot:KPI82968.1 putative SLA/LP autoantigen-like protein [Leptomonas seymouri]
MDDRCLKLAEDFVSARYIEAGRESLQATARTLRSILAQRRCPEDGLSDAAIQLCLRQLALMDTNNYAAHVGGGEREGRVISSLVRQRHFDLTHGIGRSGDLTAEQPKAAGSSLLYQVTNVLMLDLIQLSGAPSTNAAVVVPMATGMTLSLVLRCVAKSRIKEMEQLPHNKKLSQGLLQSNSVGATEETEAAAAPPRVAPHYVIWPRIDQKTALKCIDAAGLTPVPVQLRPAPPLHPHASSTRAPAASVASSSGSSCSSAFFLQCEVEDIAAAVDAVGGPAHVVCVLSTTSCFAPRLPDNTVAIARYCKAEGIPYVVNNAYGVQSRRIMARLDAAQRLGRVDYTVQSSDKNFLVPVGGSIVCSTSVEKCRAVAALYAGRASASPAIDLFITALSMGRQGMQALWAERYQCRRRLVEQLRAFANERGEILLVDDGDDAGASAAADEGGPDKKVGSDAATAAAMPTIRGKKRAASLPRNDISIAVTMRFLGRTPASKDEEVSNDKSQGTTPSSWAAARALGAELFRSAVTGPRVVLPAPSTATTIAGCTFHNYGMHQEGVPATPLLVIACGIGMTVVEVDALMDRLRALWPVV